MAVIRALLALGVDDGFPLVGVAVVSYLIGSIPWAYMIVRFVTGEDITTHGTGNVGAMNVRRTTGSWGWFALDMVADGLKGLVPVAAAWVIGLVVVHGWTWRVGATDVVRLFPQAALLGAVLGHNYSLWLALMKRRFVRTGKGLATGAGGLLAYNWQYFLIVLVVGLGTIALTRYMMAGQVAAAISLPVYTIVTGQPDWVFVSLLGGLVYAAHHRRFVGLLQGREPKLYVHDRQGPRG